MSKWRDQYFREYTVEKEVLESGRSRRVYVYHGNFYFWKNPQQVTRNKLIYTGLLALNIAVYILTSLGITPQAKYLAVPVMLDLVPMVFEMYAVVQFCIVREKVREFEFNDMNTKLLGATISNAVLASAAVLVSLYYGIQMGSWRSYVLIALGFAVCAGCAIVVFLLHKNLRPVMVEEGEGADNHKKRRMQEEAQKSPESGKMPEAVE